MAVAISLPRDDSPQQRYERERHLAAQRALYDWDRRPGLPPTCKGVPAPERFGRASAYEILSDAAESVASGALSLFGWMRGSPTQLRHYDTLYALRRPPRVMENWRSDREFARQRLNGINPFLITCIDRAARALPRHRRPPPRRAARRCHARPAAGRAASVPVRLEGRRRSTARARPLPGRADGAVLARRAPARSCRSPSSSASRRPRHPVIFTPADDLWLWLTARTYVTCADGTYHEVIAHLTRTHLVMEPVWVAACRTLPPEHPVHELLAPHFTGTIDINDEAVNQLLAPGGPIDITMSPGSDGSFWLAEQEYRRWRLDDWNPRARPRPPRRARPRRAARVLVPRRRPARCSTPSASTSPSSSAPSTATTTTFAATPSCRRGRGSWSPTTVAASPARR